MEHGSSQSRHSHYEHHGHMASDFRRRFWISLVISIPVLLLSPVIQQVLGLERLAFAYDEYVVFVLATFIFFYGGKPFLEGFVGELRARQPGMMTLVAVAIATAYGYSAAVLFGLSGKQLLWELVTLVDVMLLGHWLEMKSVMGASRALEELARLMPSFAHKVVSGTETVDVAVEELVLGDTVLVKPGEKIPVDGVVVKGESSVNEAVLTGETKPVEKKEGSAVIGGAMNGEGSLTVRIEKLGKDTYLSQIVSLVRASQESKSRTQNLANRAALWLTVIALSGGVATLFGWQLFSSQDFGFALERTIAVIVIACPHALGLAIPLVVAFSTSLLARNGLLVRNRTAFEDARKIDAIVFDKTGTLTKGEFAVSDMLVFDNALSESELLSFAGSVEAHSEHPLAKAISARAGRLYEVKQFRALPGKGAEGTVDGKTVRVVSPGYLGEQNITVSDDRVRALSSEGKTVVYVIVDDALVGALGLDDVVREEARDAVFALKRMGVKTIMLTGDSRAVARRVAEALILDEFYAEVLPDKKSALIKEIQGRGLTVAMVGDGVNDAPALAQANVGIAIGAGTDVAIETADVVLVKSNPLDVVRVIELARKTYRKMVQNLWWATGYNVIALPLAAGVAYNFGILLSPAVGAVFMSLSTVIVAFNASLLKLQRIN